MARVCGRGGEADVLGSHVDAGFRMGWRGEWDHGLVEGK